MSFFFRVFSPRGKKKAKRKKLKRSKLTGARNESPPSCARRPACLATASALARFLCASEGSQSYRSCCHFLDARADCADPSARPTAAAAAAAASSPRRCLLPIPERARATGPRGRSALDSQEEGGRGGPALARSSSASLVRSEAEEEGAGEEAAEAAEAAAEAAAGNAFNPESADRSRAASPAEGAAAAASPSPSSAEDATTAAASAPPRLTASSPPCQTWNEGRAPTPHRSASEAAALPLPPPPPPAPLPLLAAFSPPPPPVSTTAKRTSEPKAVLACAARSEKSERRTRALGAQGCFIFVF